MKSRAVGSQRLPGELGFLHPTGTRAGTGQAPVVCRKPKKVQKVSDIDGKLPGPRVWHCLLYGNRKP